MSVHVSGPAWRSTVTDVYELVVLLALADQASDEGWAFISIRKLARRCRVTQRSVYRILEKLSADGHVTVMPNPGRSSVYQVHPIIWTPDPRSGVAGDSAQTAAGDDIDDDDDEAKGATERSRVVDPVAAAGVDRRAAAGLRSLSTPDPQSGVGCGQVIPTPDPQSGTPDSHDTPPLTHSQGPLTVATDPIVPSLLRKEFPLILRRAAESVDKFSEPGGKAKEIERRKAEQLARISEAMKRKAGT